MITDFLELFERSLKYHFDYEPVEKKRKEYSLRTGGKCILSQQVPLITRKLAALGIKPLL